MKNQTNKYMKKQSNGMENAKFAKEKNVFTKNRTSTVCVTTMKLNNLSEKVILGVDIQFSLLLSLFVLCILLFSYIHLQIE